MAGRPLKFKNTEELEDLINKYFDSITITEPVYKSVYIGDDDKGNGIYEDKPLLTNAGEHFHRTEHLNKPSILGLAKFIGTTRKTLLDYENKEEFSYTIKSAKERIEQYLEEQLYRKEQVVGIIFNLKNNFGWKDKREIEHEGHVNITLEGDVQKWAK